MMQPTMLFVCDGGTLRLPERGAVLVSREDGGHLIVDPPRPVWDRTALSRGELFAWSALVAAAAGAMLETLPQLDGGCINYWDAGNWALNVAADPPGAKDPRLHRRLHLHLLGRSPRATSPSSQWGEAPRFPAFADRQAWAAAHELLTPAECRAIASRAAELLSAR
jgi:hypothetical protein